MGGVGYGMLTTELRRMDRHEDRQDSGSCGLRRDGSARIRACQSLSRFSAERMRKGSSSRSARTTAAMGMTAALRGWGLFMLAAVGPLAADTGLCLRVVDGDSLVLEMPYGEQEARLEGIDAPEIGQRFGSDAREFLADLVLGRRVEFETVGADTYGRLLIRVRVGDMQLNHEMVRRGLAWHFKRYSTDEKLSAAEEHARQARVGLWSDSKPVPPWEYRHGVRAPEAPRLLSDSPGTVHGNRSSGVYHLPSCRHYNCRNCVMKFQTEAEAQQSGFRPAGCCAGRRSSRAGR